MKGVGRKSLYADFPFFDLGKQLPQCVSHDYMEGCSKLWIKLILENLVSENWMSWDSIEIAITRYKFKGKDAANRPAPLRANQMKNKESRKVIGNFSEIAQLIRSFTQGGIQ